MAKPININLFDQKSIQAAVNALKYYENSLEYKCRLLAETMAEKGVEIAQAYIMQMDAVFTYELNSSIHAEHIKDVKGGGIWAVVAGTDHALFVEFGTGIVGKQSPYPGKFPDGIEWQYASGKTIRQLSDGRYGWFYKDDNGDWWFTEGMEPRPFMFYTANQLRDIVIETAREVFRNG